MDSTESICPLFDRLWEGATKIVIAIDLGTTKSGVAFVLLEDGMRPMIQRVTSWPGQEALRRQSKIPTAVWYDSNMKAVSFGAETMSPAIEDQAEDNYWSLAKHFKLHLFPEQMKARHMSLDPLPLGVSLLQIYTDYLGYLLGHTRDFFESRIVDGIYMRERYSPTMEVVITHPNGWGVREQAFLRKATVGAGFAKANDVLTKVDFVGEAEASVYFCLYHTNLWSRISDGATFLVCDAGGATVDLAVYSVVSKHPVPILEEKRSSVSISSGAIFVDQTFEQYLHQLLSTTGLTAEDVNDYTKHGVLDFERSTKILFHGDNREYSIQLGGSRFNNPLIGVRRGCLRLQGSTIKPMFDVCVREILTTVDKLLQDLNAPYILLVGGFGDSLYLRQEFKNRYEPQGCQVSLANDSTSKAVADGAILWKIARHPPQPVTRFALGTEISVAFDPNDPDHQHRKNIISTLGWAVVTGRWKCLITKGVIPDTYPIVQTPFTLDYKSSSDELGQLELDIYGYSGDNEPIWMKNEQGELLPDFHKAATIQMNLEDLRGALESKISSDGILEWQLIFNVCVQFGDTQLKAHLKWKEKELMRTGPCIPIPILDKEPLGDD